MLVSNQKWPRRFLFIQAINLPLVASRDVLPNLVMAIRYDNFDSQWDCVISVFKRLSIGSLIVLLGTPLRHPERDHRLCLYPSNATLYPAASQHELPAECVAYTVKPRIRPVEIISGVHLRYDGAIHGSIPERLRRISTSVRLYDTSLTASYNDYNPGPTIYTRLCETAMQLLKLRAMHSRYSEVAIWEEPIHLPRERYGCLFARGNPQWDMEFINLAEEALESFLHEVSQRPAS